MKTLIRKGVFETNSSSCHSITVAENNTFNDVPSPDDDGNIFIYSGEFGWEQDTHRDFGSKAAYLIVYIRDWVGDDTNKYREIFENVIKEVTQCEAITYEDKFWDFENESYEETTWDSTLKQNVKTGIIRTYKSKLGEGYIDHQSVEDRDLDKFFNEPEKMKRLLFNSSSYIETDNDNH